MGKRVELWDGWSFYEGVIYDEAGNRYTKKDILMSWQASLLVSENFSSTGKIKIMRKELEKKIRETKALPELCLIWNCPKNGVIEEVYTLKEG